MSKGKKISTNPITGPRGNRKLLKQLSAYNLNPLLGNGIYCMLTDCANLPSFCNKKYVIRPLELYEP